jgi:hypothetical protein
MSQRQEKFILHFEPDYFDYLVLSALEYSQDYKILKANTTKINNSGGGTMNRLVGADEKDFERVNRPADENFLQVAQSALKKYRKSTDISRPS